MFEMTFKEIASNAKSEWEALQNGSYILIGTATCGRAAGALDVVDAFNSGLARQGLQVPVIQVGCMGLCYAEPLVTICKSGSLRVVYSNVTPEIVPRLVEGYVGGDDPCLELALGTLEGVVEKQSRFLSFPGLNMSFAFYYSVVVTAILRISTTTSPTVDMVVWRRH